MEIEKRKINEYFLVFFVFLLYFFAFLKITFIFEGIKNAPIMASITSFAALITLYFTFKLYKFSKFVFLSIFVFQLILDVSIILKSGKTSYSVFTFFEVLFFYYIFLFLNKTLHLPYFMPKTPFFALTSNKFIPKLSAKLLLNNVVYDSKITTISSRGCYLFTDTTIPKFHSAKITLEFNEFSCTMMGELRSAILSKNGFGLEFHKSKNSNDSFLELSNLISSLRRTGYVE